MTESESNPMQPRRFLLSLATAALIAGLALAPPAGAQTASQATAFIRATGNAMVQVVNSDEPDAVKARAMARIIDQRVAVNEIARFCLGPFWRTASPAQQKEYLGLFHRVLVFNIDAKMGQYRGVSFTTTRTVPGEGGQVVGTIINRPNQPPAKVDWVVRDIDGSPKIVDVIAEGVSLEVTQRSDYSSFILQNNQSIQALLNAMKRQVSSS
jgi:phospholipid transport system substrate-binding protein